ncbi:hypothetical protein F2Q69_00063430 [Brassica cretica]|uniref:RRM domain-containing protein n=1 Tax=Brassica cretica TaxID=69181 RepID=A0A8S9RAG2_BRACR|nr:hypothetical protein F2Q69_00063430 [Brassica cretica]
MAEIVGNSSESVYSDEIPTNPSVGIVSIRRISVEGYDTSLRLEDVDEALRKHFASCGKIIHVSIPRNSDWTILCQYAFVYFNEEDEEKALRLDGSDMGGRILQIKAKVTGYDNSLSLDIVRKEIEEYFSACGSFVYPHKTSARATKIKSYIYLDGQEAVDKALERSGGLNLVVTKVEPIPKTPEKTGYIPPHIYARFKEQIDDPKLYFIIDPKSETSEGNQKKKKKKTKTREGNQKKRSETTEGNQKKKKSKTKEGNQKKKEGNQKGVEICF